MNNQAHLEDNGQRYTFDLNKPLDISICTGSNSAKAWYVDHAKISPVMTDRFTGSVKLGGAVNFNNITFNPHGNSTHTECVGHISKEFYSINNCLKSFLHQADLITIQPETLKQDESEWVQKGDLVITADLLKAKLPNPKDALIIRTIPNLEQKRTKDWSFENWPYLTESAAEFLRLNNVKHLLLDLPSVDRKDDGGLLRAHHIFWNYPENPRLDATITEMIYVDDSIPDGQYLLNLQPCSLDNDAAPVKPVIYPSL